MYDFTKYQCHYYDDTKKHVSRLYPSEELLLLKNTCCNTQLTSLGNTVSDWSTIELDSRPSPIASSRIFSSISLVILPTVNLTEN